MPRAPQYGFGDPPIRSDVYGHLPDPRVVSFTRGGRRAEDPIITIDGRTLEQKFILHSDGLEFGYMGSGPADTALNILALVVSPHEATRLHQSFKFDVLSKIGREGGSLPLELVREWVRQKYEEELNDPLCQAHEKAMREARDLDDDEDPCGDPNDDTPTRPVELVKSCDDPHCKECRTGESDESNFLTNVERLLCRQLDVDERQYALRYMETGHGPEYTAKVIAAEAAGLTGDEHVSTNFGHW